MGLGELLERTVPALGYELVDWDMRMSQLIDEAIAADRKTSGSRAETSLTPENEPASGPER